MRIESKYILMLMVVFVFAVLVVPSGYYLYLYKSVTARSVVWNDLVISKNGAMFVLPGVSDRKLIVGRVDVDTSSGYANSYLQFNAKYDEELDRSIESLCADKFMCGGYEVMFLGERIQMYGPYGIQNGEKIYHGYIFLESMDITIEYRGDVELLADAVVLLSLVKRSGQ